MPGRPTLLDASALIAFILNEKGRDIVERALEAEAYITSVNLSDTVSRLLKEAMSFREIRFLLTQFPLTVIDVGTALAYEAAALETHTRKYGLSLGDRMCLAAAKHTGHTALTADRLWQKLSLPGVTIQLIR